MYTNLIFLTLITLNFTRVLFVNDTAKDEDKTGEDGQVEQLMD